MMVVGELRTVVHPLIKMQWELGVKVSDSELRLSSGVSGQLP